VPPPTDVPGDSDRQNGGVTSERRTRIAIASAPNLRDLGGWPTSDGGSVRSGVAYRSAGLDRLDEDDLEAFGELDVRAVFDLRTAAEVASQPDALPDGLVAQNLDVLADANHAAPAELQQIFADPARASEQMRDGQAEAYFEEAYRGFVSLPSARNAYRRLFEGIAEADGPVLFHCATGKDRTGWATAVLFLLLGVPGEQVMEEYLLTNTELLPTLQPWLDQFEASGGDPRLLIPVLGVQESYLEAALEQVRATYGTAEEYAATGLGLSPDTLAALRAKLVDSVDTELNRQV
jgi:protein-tyrosine phosphatase